MVMQPDSSRHRLTFATWLTLGRIVLVLPIVVCLLMDLSIWAFGLLIVAGLTDFLDGYIARHNRQESRLGTILDPIADKLVTISVLIAFVANGTLNSWQLLPVFLIIAREILISGLREAGAGVSLPVSSLAKMKTTMQFLALLILCFGMSSLAAGLIWAAAFLTLWTGADYLFKWLSSVPFSPSDRGVPAPSAPPAPSQDK